MMMNDGRCGRNIIIIIIIIVIIVIIIIAQHCSATVVVDVVVVVVVDVIVDLVLVCFRIILCYYFFFVPVRFHMDRGIWFLASVSLISLVINAKNDDGIWKEELNGKITRPHRRVDRFDGKPHTQTQTHTQTDRQTHLCGRE